MAALAVFLNKASIIGTTTTVYDDGVYHTVLGRFSRVRYLHSWNRARAKKAGVGSISPSKSFRYAFRWRAYVVLRVSFGIDTL